MCVCVDRIALNQFTHSLIRLDQHLLRARQHNKPTTHNTHDTTYYLCGVLRKHACTLAPSDLSGCVCECVINNVCGRLRHVLARSIENRPLERQACEKPPHRISHTQSHRHTETHHRCSVQAKHETTKTRSLTQREHVRTVRRPETDYASIGVYLSSAAAASQDHGTQRRGRFAFARRA